MDEPVTFELIPPYTRFTCTAHDGTPVEVGKDGFTTSDRRTVADLDSQNHAVRRSEKGGKR